MNTSSAVRHEVEAALSGRVPGALSPQVRAERVRLATGIEGVDAIARGGFPVGAITELVGAESSGRTTLVASFAAGRVAEGQVCAWVDVTDALDPESMAAAGVDLERMLWVRCGRHRDPGMDRVVAPGAAMVDRSRSAPSVGGGCGSPHPRSEGRGLPQAIGGLMGGLAAELVVGGEAGAATSGRALLPAKRRDKSIGTPSAPNRAVKPGLSWRSADREEQVATDRRPTRRGGAVMSPKTGGWEPRCTADGGSGRRERAGSPDPRQGSHVAAAERFARSDRNDSKQGQGRGSGAGCAVKGNARPRPWSAIEQALRATDMLLQAGGFGVVVLDLGGVDAEAAWRIPMATWFRFRAAAERSQTCLILLTQHACARSSAELVLEMETGAMRSEGRVMTGAAYGANVGRQRFVALETRKVVAIRDVEERSVDAGDGGVAGKRRAPQGERPGAWYGDAAWAQAGGVADMWPAAAEGRVRRRAGGAR